MIMQRARLLAGITLLGLLFQQAKAQMTIDSSENTGIRYTLQQCVDSAIRNNPTVKASEFTKDGAKINWQQQRATMLPAVSGYADFVNNGGRSINIYTNSYITENFNSGYYLVLSVDPLIRSLFP